MLRLREAVGDDGPQLRPVGLPEEHRRRLAAHDAGQRRRDDVGHRLRVRRRPELVRQRQERR